MAMLMSMIAEDFRIQIRSYFYAATFFMLAVIALVILIIPASPLPPKFTALLIFSDSAVMGLAFVGALVLMEKGAGTLSALSVTPLPGWIYVASKIITFTSLGVFSGMVVASLAMGGAINIPVMLSALIISNMFSVLLGFALISRTDSVNGFLANLLMASFILALPLAAYFNLAPDAVSNTLKLIPSYAMLITVEAGLSYAPIGNETIIAAIYLAAWIIGGWIWTVRDYDAHLATGGL